MGFRDREHPGAGHAAWATSSACCRRAWPGSQPVRRGAGFHQRADRPAALSRRRTSPWQDLRPRTGGTSTIWPWAMCLSEIIRSADKAYDKLGFYIHDYFFAKALDQVRPGGVDRLRDLPLHDGQAKTPMYAGIWPSGPNCWEPSACPTTPFAPTPGRRSSPTFFFCKSGNSPIDIEPEWVHLGQTEDGIPVNSYFAEHPEMVLGNPSLESTQYGRAGLHRQPAIRRRRPGRAAA